MIELSAHMLRGSFRRRLSAIIGAAFLFATPLPALAAGILCGTVRDADTHQPIVRAGVFLRTTDGVYTGLHAASDALGKFCIGDIPPGTYDVEVRVDEYLFAYVRNVVVTDANTDVGDALVTRLALLPPAPNPVRDRLHLRFAMAAAGPATLEVLDTAGRVIKGWRATSLGAGTHGVTWDLRDQAERTIPPGRYFVRLTFGGARAMGSFVRIP